ncbi:MAG: hypothetical protein AB7N76_18395 [Planctomycetota bacterium]
MLPGLELALLQEARGEVQAAGDTRGLLMLSSPAARACLAAARALQAEDWSEGLARLDEALGIDRRMEHLRALRGWALLRLKREPEGLAELEVATRAGAGDHDALLALANSALEGRDLARARDALDRCLVGEPRFPEGTWARRGCGSPRASRGRRARWPSARSARRAAVRRRGATPGRRWLASRADSGNRLIRG